VTLMLNYFASSETGYLVTNLIHSRAKEELLHPILCIHVLSYTGTEVILSSELNVFRNIRFVITKYIYIMQKKTQIFDSSIKSWVNSDVT